MYQRPSFVLRLTWPVPLDVVRLTWLVALGAATALLGLTPAQGQNHVVIRLPETDDAWLEDVTFLDPQRGWACGRGGVIWHTADGGQNWELQHAEPGITLHSVRFVDELHGWAVGGIIQPMSWRTAAVLLKTSSGGRRWTRVDTPGLPELTHVKFFDQNRGVAVGFSSTLYPTGILATTDGGRSWSGLGGSGNGPWSAALWRSPTDGVLLNESGLYEVRNGEVAPANPERGASADGQVLFPTADGQGYWLAGTSALLKRRLTSRSSWESMEWQLPDSFRPAALDKQGNLKKQIAPDFHTAATYRDHIWLAGAPGSFVLHSPDGGQTWERQLTGQPLPITRICFVDERHGWAVGALGVILATRNGGATWHVQRQGGVRLAVWSLHSSPTQLPLPTLAYFASQEGWLVGTTCLQPFRYLAGQDPALAVGRRMQAALERVGASAAVLEPRFPVSAYHERADLGASMAHWQQRYGAEAERRWMEYVQWQLAQWRPDVVAFGRFDSEESDGVDRFLHRTLMQAIQVRGQSPASWERFRSWGLEPWKPQKLVEWTPSRQRAHRSMPITQLLPLVYSSVGDYAWPAQLYLKRSPSRWPDYLGWRVVWRGHRTSLDDTLVDSSAERSVAYIRRKPPQVTLQLKRINEIAQALKEIHNAAVRVSELHQNTDWPGSLQRYWQQLPPTLAGQSMFQLALACADEGEWNAATLLVTSFVKQFPTHPLSESALWWLLRHRGSHEINFALRQRQAPVQQAAFLDGATLMEPRDAWAVLVSRYPELESDPLIALPFASRLSFDDPGQALRILGSVAAISDQRWARVAKAELWLSESRGKLPVPAIRMAPVTRPVLDGNLNEPFWADAPAVSLVPMPSPDLAAPAPKTIIKVAFDREHLYLAAVCEKPRNDRKRRIVPRNSRDQAQRSIDHLHWEIDVDRDYSTAFAFTIDCRGLVSDSCCGVLSWNPQWYVAARESSREWIVECAIPWSELDARPPRADSPMALRFSRAQPGTSQAQWPPVDSTTWGWLMSTHQGNLSDNAPARD